MPSNAASPLSVFISYSHRDEDYKDDLVVHLATLKRQGKIRAWQDRDIEAGAEWDAEIKQQLESAEIILLLITPRFLASDYCYDLEIQRAMQRHEEGTARVIPIIVKPCDWQGTSFSKLQVVPKDAKPITKWDDQDDAFLDVVKSIRRTVESFQANRVNSPERSNPQTFANTQNHNLTEKQQNLLKWMVQEVRAGKLDEEEIWFLWTFNGTSVMNYQDTVPETKPATLDALKNDGCLICERKTNSEYRFALTRRAYDIADSISIVESQEADPSKKAIGATVSNATLPVAPTLSAPPTSITSPIFSTYNPATFAGREAETAHLTTLLSSNCRILAIVGMTGIGKTALAERVVAHLMQTPEAANLPYYRFSLDDRSLTPDFASSGAALLRTLGEEPTLADQQDPVNLLAHLLNHLQSQPCRVQIDSLERLLRGNEQDGWSEFCDPLWLDLLQQFLAATNSHSQLLLTSQDIPADLDTVASRYPQFWHCEALQGLSADEQQTLFKKLGLPQDADSVVYLSRIGEFYNGHPLVLQVIADEICQPPFQGNVARYWHHYKAEFTATPATSGNKLDRSRFFRRRVRQRVEQSLQRLPAPARQMLCASAVFRRPVPVEFWYAMLADDPEAAFDTLQDRHLVEFAPSLDDSAPLLVRQHNLIRSVAYDLLKADTSTWEAAEREAAHLWLTAYEPAPDAPNLETVRGYLEAFDHYYKVGEWEKASEIYSRQLASTNQALHWQLLIWGYYKELIEVSHKLVDRITSQTKRLCLNQMGNSYKNLGNVERAIDYYQQALQFTRKTGDRQGEGRGFICLGQTYDRIGQYQLAIDYYEQALPIARETGDTQAEGTALGSLGGAYQSLGQYERAIDCHQQHLTIAREIGNRLGEGSALGSLGFAYDSLGQYERAIDFHQQYLTIAREIGDRRGEGNALGGLGNAYNSLEQYERAIDFYQQNLTIAREIGDRQGEGDALGSLGLAYDSLGQYERAIDFHQQYLTTAREIGDRQGEGAALGNLGETQLKLKEYPESLTNTQAALEIFQEIGARAGEAEALKNLAELHQALGEVEVARLYGQQALALATELGIPLKAECEALLQQLGSEGNSEI